MLKIRSEIDVEPIAFELYELEVTPPREDFELEIARTIQVARSKEAPAVGRARELYRRFGPPPTRDRPSSDALPRRPEQDEPLPQINSLVDRPNTTSVPLQIPGPLPDPG